MTTFLKQSHLSKLDALCPRYHNFVVSGLRETTIATQKASAISI